jgi:HNH endonuclease/NUMOD4 motif
MEKPSGCWLPVAGYEDRYEVSSTGLVWSLRRNRLLKAAPGKKTRGYLYVGLWDGKRSRTRKVHLLVLAAFRGPRPPGMQARHWDGDHQNNDESNLSWGTPGENALDNVRNGVHNQARKDCCPECHGPYKVNANGKRYCPVEARKADKAWRDRNPGESARRSRARRERLAREGRPATA